MINGQPELDPYSETWQAVKAHIDGALKSHRGVCETPGMPITDTENARGAILALNGILKLGVVGASKTPQGE